MKPIEVPAVDDERILVPFVIPVKGRKPLEFKLPRRDFTPSDDVRMMEWLAAEAVRDKDKLAEWVDPEERDAGVKAVYLISLRPYVSDAQFKVLQTLVIGQITFIIDQLNRFSNITVGESWASTDSSRGSTGRPSKPTLSTADTEDGTSDAA